MTKDEATVKLAMWIATQAIKSGAHNVDLSWLSIGDMLDFLTSESVGMHPPYTKLDKLNGYDFTWEENGNRESKTE